jgi:hypothetical protein
MIPCKESVGPMHSASPDGKRGSGSGLSGAVSVDAKAVHQQAERILAHPLFRYSKRYSDLLSYIVDRSLTGNDESLRERTIGVEVFGRDRDYDPSLDPTVRVVAIEVRKRLFLYYNEAEREQELRIEIPARSYTAQFSLPVPKISEEKPAPTQANAAKSPPSAQSFFRNRWVWLATLISVTVAAVALWSINRLTTPTPVIRGFWAPLLADSGSALICIGSSPSRDAISDKGSPDIVEPGTMYYLFRQRRGGEVSMTEVTAASELTLFLERNGKSAVIRPVRDTNLSDLKSHATIILGSYNNEWAMRLGSKTRFQFRIESEHGLRWIEDSTNPNRNWSLDVSTPYEQVDVEYSLVTRMLDPSTGRWWVGIGGLTGSGTQAAYEMLIDPSAMATLGERLPKGWEHKNLQMVLATRLIDGSPGATQVAAAHSW